MATAGAAEALSLLLLTGALRGLLLANAAAGVSKIVLTKLFRYATMPGSGFETTFLYGRLFYFPSPANQDSPIFLGKSGF